MRVTLLSAARTIPSAPLKTIPSDKLLPLSVLLTSTGNYTIGKLRNTFNFQAKVSAGPVPEI
jgi:hypothetical protein